MTTALQFVNVCASYNKDTPVLRGVNLTLAAGEKIGLSGGNGSGKTTLLHAALGLVEISSGHVTLLGQPCRTEHDFRRFRGRVGLVFQDADDQLFSPTVAEDVAFGPLNQGRPRDEVRQIVARTLENLGLGGYENRPTHQLSGGEKRLASLATVLAMSPEVLLLDEPTLGLDESSERRLLDILAALPQAIIIVSHDRKVMSRLTSRLIHLDGGIIN